MKTFRIESAVYPNAFGPHDPEPKVYIRAYVEIDGIEKVCFVVTRRSTILKWHATSGIAGVRSVLEKLFVDRHQRMSDVVATVRPPIDLESGIDPNVKIASIPPPVSNEPIVLTEIMDAASWSSE